MGVWQVIINSLAITGAFMPRLRSASRPPRRC